MSGHGRSGGRPTLEEVAARAGVGRGTVSRVINGSSKVSEHTRAVVEAAVAELGYVPNRAARALAANRTDAVALVIPEPEARFFAEPYFSDVVRGVGAALAETDVQLVLTLVEAATASAAASPSTCPGTAWTGCSSSPSTPGTRCPTCWPSSASRR